MIQYVPRGRFLNRGRGRARWTGLDSGYERHDNTDVPHLPIATQKRSRLDQSTRVFSRRSYTAEPTGLEPDAIGVVQNTVIGMAASAPSASVGLTIAGLAAVTAYGSGPVIILTAIPMLIIANATAD